MPMLWSQSKGDLARSDRTGARILHGLVLAGTVFVLVACGGLSVDQRQAVREFGQASADFGDTTVVVVKRLPRVVARLNTYNLALTPGEDEIDFDGPFDERDVGARIMAARTIQNYAGLLLALGDPDNTSVLRTEGDKFIASVRSLGENKAMSDGDLGTAGKIIAGIGGLMIERDAANALKQIVPATHPQIVRLGGLFAKEFGSAGAVPTYMDAQALTLEKNAMTYLRQRNAASDRMVGSRGLRLAERTVRQTQKVYPPVATTANQMVAAHAKLVTALQTNEVSFEDIKAFVKGARDLATTTTVFAGS